MAVSQTAGLDPGSARRTFLRHGLLWLSAALIGGARAHDTERLQRTISRRFGAEALERFHAWRAMIGQAAALPEYSKLRTVNDFVNRLLRFEDDIVVWGVDDYWASPLEMLGKGEGDCEDFALIKYFSLIEAGVARSKLRLIYVRAVLGGASSANSVAHMVLGYFDSPASEPLVLDNLIAQILSASQRPDLTPAFSFNGEGIWAPGAVRVSQPVDRLSRWTELLQRMQAEGFEP